MSKEQITVYTDGGCRNTGNRRGGQVQANDLAAWAVRLRYLDHVKELTGGERGRTNNYMELMAVIQGLKALKRVDLPVVVYADSQYVINGMTQRWWVKWQRQNWRDEAGNPRKNAALWQELLAQAARFETIAFQKVKGHAYDTNNNAVDALLNRTMDAM